MSNPRLELPLKRAAATRAPGRQARWGADGHAAAGCVEHSVSQRSLNTCQSFELCATVNWALASRLLQQRPRAAVPRGGRHRGVTAVTDGR